MTITYHFGNNLYLNITNRCSCNCEFCIRIESQGVGDGDNLWLEHEPSLQEIQAALDTQNLSSYESIVICGYGEPTERLDVMLDVCRYLKAKPECPPIRLNTNGLSDLINKKETASLLEGLIDTVSISLNAPNAERYQEIVHSAFGLPSYDSMLNFSARCKKVVPQVLFSVVAIIPQDEIEQCKAIAEKMDIPLRVREKQ